MEEPTRKIPDVESVFTGLLKCGVDAMDAGTILFTMAVFGLAAIIFGVANALWISILAGGGAGALKIFHGNRKALLYTKNKNVQPNTDYLELLSTNRYGAPVVSKEFEHRGFKFNILSLEKLNIPLAVSEPLCTRCGDKPLFESQVLFPGRIRIKCSCLCGFSEPVLKTKEELRKEAALLGGIGE